MTPDDWPERKLLPGVFAAAAATASCASLVECHVISIQIGKVQISHNN